ncbi:MAG TPA: ribosome small subunit-dependent GTPase A [Candidatus Nanopelagicaceae bacterium]
MGAREFDESDVRIRPSRSTRPRSKDRPSHSDAINALVTTVDRGRTTCITDDGTIVVTMKSRELGPKSVVVGDQVGIVGDTSGTIGSLARIVTVQERKNSLSRTVDDAAKVERIIVANIDQLIIVVASTNPEPRRGLIDRFLVSAFDQGITPFILVTKVDLGDPPSFLDEYRNLNVQVLTTKKGGDISQLRTILQGKTSVLVGHSGVGKSTVINALVPHAQRVIGKVNEVTGRGRHTSSSAIALPLSTELKLSDGWIIDTPGIRAFGLAHIDPNRIIASFGDLREVIAQCMPNCSHSEAGCALNDWAAPQGKVIPERQARIESLRNLLDIKLD